MTTFDDYDAAIRASWEAVGAETRGSVPDGQDLNPLRNLAAARS